MCNITNYYLNAKQNNNEVSLHTARKAIIKKTYKQKMLERVCRRGNPLKLLVAMQIDTANVKNTMEVP